MSPQVYEGTTFHFYILDFYQHRLTTLYNWLRPIVKHYIEKVVRQLLWPEAYALYLAIFAISQPFALYTSTLTLMILPRLIRSLILCHLNEPWGRAKYQVLPVSTSCNYYWCFVELCTACRRDIDIHPKSSRCSTVWVSTQLGCINDDL